MAEWKKYTLEEVCERIYSGGTPSTKHEEYWNGNVKWLSSGETAQRFVYDTDRKITKKGVENSSTKLATKGCTVIATAGQGYTRGQASFLMIDTYMNQSVIACKANESIILPLYLYYNLDSRYEEFRLLSDGTSTRGGLSGWIMKRMEIKLPPISLQEKIVDILYSIDKKIELNNAINNNLEQQAVLLFKKCFIELDSTSNNMVDTQFGLIPDTFRLLKNGELPLVVTDYVANGSFASLKANVTLYQEPNYAYFIRNTDLKSGTFEVFVDKHSYDFLSKSTLHGGEIIISNVGDVGSVFLCPKLDKPMTLGNNIIMLRPEQDNMRYYLYIWFKWLYGQSLIQGITGGSAQPKFNKTDFKNLQIFLPPDDLLEQFHQIVKPMFELIDENNVESQTLTITRDTLLPRLMSGELDISNIEI